MNRGQDAFRVVDLAAQGCAVARYVAGWPRDTLLAWLRLFGDVRQPVDTDDTLHWFTSRSGLSTGFVITHEGRFLLVGDHTIYEPCQDDRT